MPRKSTTVDNPDYLIELAAGFQASQILFTAVEFELFGILAGRALTAEQVARAANLPPRSLTRLLNGAAHLGLLQFKKGKYLNAPMSKKYLMQGKPEYLGDLVRAYSRMLYDKWGRLDSVIRNEGAECAPSTELEDQKASEVINVAARDTQFDGSLLLLPAFTW